MTRRDTNLDAMLRHLGAAYYESRHGRATAADVSRALDSVEEHTGDVPDSSQAGKDNPADAGQHAHRGARSQHYGHWPHRVRDVMTTSVVTVDRITPYKEIATLLAKHKISAVPVLILGRHVAGVVSEADLLAIEDKHERAARLHWETGGLHLLRRQARHWGLTAAELMTSPAVTIHPDATLPAAARLMNSHHLKRLPVVGPDGTLVGIVSRRDLLSVFLRPDEEIAREARELLSQILLTEPEAVTVRVRNGVVTLTGHPGADDDRDLIPVVMRLSWDIDGVVDVANKISATVPN
jgi:CBS domain-containing protein